MKKTIYLLEHRGGYWSLYHFFIYNLGGLYYINNKQFNIRHTDSIKINDNRLVNKPSNMTYPITICLEKQKGPMINIIKETFEILKDRYIFIDKLPSDKEYEIVSIYGEPCFLNTASNNPTNVFPFLRELFLSRVDTTKYENSKRFFIGRKKSLITKNTYHKTTIRTLLNEQEFIKKLKTFNITCIYLEDLSVEEKIKLFNNAELIIGTNSSALTCLLWCNINVKIIEILNKPICCGKGDHYKLISNTLNLKYYRYSDIDDDKNGNFIIKNDSKIYDFIKLI